MESSDIIQLVCLLLLLVLSGFFSMSETALTTCNKIRIRALAEEGNKRAKTLLQITENAGKMLSAILIGNNVVNLSASSLATVLAMKLFGSAGAGIATGVLTILILIFGEISPKSAATIYSQEVALAVTPAISFCMTVLTPVIYAVNWLSRGFLKLIRIDADKKEAVITEQELRTVVEVSHEEGVIEKDERKMINNVVDFGDARAKDIMVARADMTMIEVNASYRELIELFRQERFTRIPVYEDARDNVIGAVNMKDLLLVTDEEAFHIRDYLRPVQYTFENKKLSEMLTEMRESSRNLSIVLNEYGSAVGMVTLEDLLEEIVGEIRDEYDEEEKNLVKTLGENEYLIEGSMKLDDLNELLELSLQSEDYDTIGGLVIQLLDRLPRTGDQVQYGNLTLTVDSMVRNRIRKVHMKIGPEQAQSGEM